jgi:hypothetical protein
MGFDSLTFSFSPIKLQGNTRIISALSLPLALPFLTFGVS